VHLDDAQGPSTGHGRPIRRASSGTPSLRSALTRLRQRASSATRGSRPARRRSG
jgi:hypothetical protein